MKRALDVALKRIYVPVHVCNYSSAYAPCLHHSPAIFDAACKLVTHSSSSCILGGDERCTHRTFLFGWSQQVFFLNTSLV